MGLYDNKVVVVTGASSGIGEHMARRFYEEGAFVAVCSRSQERIERAVSAYADGHDPRIMAVAADMTDRRAVTAFMAAVVERFGRIDILINNAGLSRPKSTVEVLPEDFDVTVQTKFQGYFFMSQAAARDMLRRGEGGTEYHGDTGAGGVRFRQCRYRADDPFAGSGMG